MKAVMIAGSARKGGNTDVLCGAASAVFEENGYDVTVFRPYDMDIAHCTNCGGCKRTGICVIDDDMIEIYRSIETSDVVIFCTPVHFSGMSSIMKQVVDRLQCMWYRTVDRNMITGAMISGGSPEPYFKNIVSVLKAVTNTLGAEWAGEYVIKHTDKGMPDDVLSNVSEYVCGIIERQRLSRI